MGFEGMCYIVTVHRVSSMWYHSADMAVIRCQVTYYVLLKTIERRFLFSVSEYFYLLYIFRLCDYLCLLRISPGFFVCAVSFPANVTVNWSIKLQPLKFLSSKAACLTNYNHVPSITHTGYNTIPRGSILDLAWQRTCSCDTRINAYMCVHISDKRPDTSSPRHAEKHKLSISYHMSSGSARGIVV